MKMLDRMESGGGHDLRTRYAPVSRIRYGLAGLAPWLDMMLIVLYLLLLQSRIVLQPGLVVELPPGDPEPGLHSPLIAVAVVTGTARAPVCKVYFENEPYVLDDPERLDALQSAIELRRRLRGETALTLYADARVENRYLSKLIQMARRAGMQRINLGTQPVDGMP